MAAGFSSSSNKPEIRGKKLLLQHIAYGGI
jgi:hypothetical protein